MPDNTAQATEQKKKEIPAPPCDITISRNGVALGLTNYRIVKGDDVDKFYPAVAVTPANIDTVIQWLGKDTTLVAELQTILKRRSQNIWRDSFSSEGVFDQALFEKYMTDFTSAGLKLKEINDKLDELGVEMTKFVESGTWMTDDTAKAKLVAMNDEVRAYRQMKEDRQRKPKVDTEDAPSVQAN